MIDERILTEQKWGQTFGPPCLNCGSRRTRRIEETRTRICCLCGERGAIQIVNGRAMVVPYE